MCYYCHSCYHCWCGSTGQQSFYRWVLFAVISENQHLLSDSLGMLPMVQMLSVWKQMCLAWNPMVHGPLQWPLHLCKLLFLGSTAEGMTVPGCCAMCPTVRGAKWNNNNLCSMMERVLQSSLNSCTLFAIPRAAGSILRSAWAAKCCLPPAVFAAV